MATNPYAPSSAACIAITDLCRNYSARKINPDIYRPHEAIIAANEKLIVLCRLPKLRDLRLFVTQNRHWLFMGYGLEPGSECPAEGLALCMLKEQFPIEYAYLKYALVTDIDAQLKQLVLLNYTGIEATRLRESNPDTKHLIQTITEIQFEKLIICACSIRDPQLAIRLLRERHTNHSPSGLRHASSLSTQPPFITHIIVSLVMSGYLGDLRLYRAFLYLFVRSLRTEPTLQYCARYVLRHAAEAGHPCILSLLLSNIEFSWLTHTGLDIRIGLDHYTRLPTCIIPHILEICLGPDVDTMIAVIFLTYLSSNIPTFDSSYRMSITLACRNGHTDAACFLILGYEMTDSDAVALWRVTETHIHKDILLEAIMISNAAYSTRDIVKTETISPEPEQQSLDDLLESWSSVSMNQ